MRDTEPISTIQPDELTSTPSTSYNYDSNGNLTSETNSSGTTTYSWDYENRMTSATLPNNGGTITFNYDPFARRIEKVSPNATSIFVYDGDNLVETVNSSGGEVARYTQGQNIDELLAMQRGSTTDYYEADGLGSITSLTATNGTVTQSYTYDSFGNTTNSSGSLTNFFRYTAREFDTETNLYYYRARYYDPTTGRFISEDPIRFSGGVDFYPYVKGNPLTLSDPFGWGPDGQSPCGGTTDCGKYRIMKRYDLYVLCNIFPNNPKSNCVRLCLQQSFSAGSNGVGSYGDPSIGVGPAGGVVNLVGQAYGPVTHLTCFSICGVF